MSIQHLYQMSRRAFSAYTAAINTAGQNIANAGVDGYARRRLGLASSDLASQGYYTRPFGTTPTGTGVQVTSYDRVRDRMLSAAAWEAQTPLGYYDERMSRLEAIEGTFAVGSGASLPDVLNNFWDSWATLADNPTDPAARQAVIGRGDALVTTVSTLSSNLASQEAEAQLGLSEAVGQANKLLEEIATLNTQIRVGRQGGTPDLAAEDRRDEAVRELSAFMPVEVRDAPDGYQLTVGGMRVVQGDTVNGLEVVGPPDQSTTDVRFAGTNVTLDIPEGGRLQGLVETLNTTIPGLRSDLDGLVSRLVTEVNGLHGSGYAADGTTGLPFFDAAGTTAATFALDSGLSADTLALYGGANTPGDTSPAQALAALRSSFSSEATALISSVGEQVDKTQTRLTSQASVADYLAAVEQGVRGVSIDEELTNLMQYQQAYAASARVLETTERLMDTLLAL